MNWSLLAGAVGAAVAVYVFRHIRLGNKPRPVLGWIVGSLLLIIVGNKYPLVLFSCFVLLLGITAYYLLTHFKRMGNTSRAVVGVFTLVLLLATWGSYSGAHNALDHHRHASGLNAGGGGQSATAGNTTPDSHPVNVTRTCNGQSQLQYCLDQYSTGTHPVIDAFCSATQAQCLAPAVRNEVVASALSIADLSGESTKIVEVNSTGTVSWYSFTATSSSKSPSFLWTDGKVITCTNSSQNVFGVTGPNGTCVIDATAASR